MNFFFGIIVYFLFWIVLSIVCPLGILGDIGFRSLGGFDLKKYPWTYAVSAIPVTGPIATFIILRNDIKVK